MGQQRCGEKVTSVPKRKTLGTLNKQGSFPKCEKEKEKVNVWAGRPTNEGKENVPEKVQRLWNPTLNPTNNTKMAEMPPKYKIKNVSTRKVVKFDKINLLENSLENRVEIVSDVVVVDSDVKQSVEQEYVVQAGSSPVEKSEEGSHQETKEARIPKRKRLEEDAESPRRKKFGRGGDSVSVFDQKCEPNRAGGGGSNVKNLLAKFGNMANETLYGVRRVKPSLERAKAVHGSAEQRVKICSKPMAASLQGKHCEQPIENIERGTSKK